MDLETAKKQFREGLQRGTVCPCCERKGKIRVLGITAEMAYAFMILVHKYIREPRYYSTRDLFPKEHKATTDAVSLVHWGLIEKKSDSGRSPYRPTDSGMRFYHNQELVPTHVHLFDNKPLRFSDKKTNIVKVFEDSPHDYNQLLRGDFR